jgi:hypothetical protein
LPSAAPTPAASPGTTTTSLRSGARIEVKTSGYLPNWAQAKHSALSFGRVAARNWDANTNVFGEAPEVRAGIFVFAVQTCKDHAGYDALDVSQWEFYVVAAEAVRDSGYKTLGISWVRKQARAVRFGGLTAAAEQAASAVRR